MVVPVGAAFEAELERESGAKPVYIVDLDFTSGHRRFALWPYDVTYDGDTYQGLGPIQSFGPVEWGETPLTELFVGFFVQNDPALLADLQQNSRNRFCWIRLVYVNDSNAAINDDSLPLAYRRQVPGPLSGGLGTYTSGLGLESRLHRHRNAAPRTYSHAEQLRRDATDFCLQDMGKQLDLTRRRYVQKSGLPG